MRECFTYISELTKSIAVPFAPNINIPQLTKGDSNPLYMTLPIAEVGRRSKNGLNYDEQLVSEIEQQIKAGGITGIFGHIPEGMEDSAFPLPDVYWVGAQRIGRELYAKGYLATQRAREFYERAGAALVKAATSIYGLGKRQPQGDGTHTLSEFHLQSLDFAPFDRAALPLSGDFVLTAEMLDFGYVTAMIRVPLGEKSNGADVVASMHKTLDGLQASLGAGASINIQLEAAYSPDEPAQAAEIAHLKGELALAQQQIHELQQPIPITDDMQPRIPFNMAEHNAVMREFNSRKNVQALVDGYIKLLMETMALETAHKQAIAELRKPRTLFGHDSQRDFVYLRSEQGVRETLQKFQPGASLLTTPPSTPTFDRERMLTEEGRRELLAKFGR